MSAYTKTTNFTAKDSLTSGNPSKVVKGSEIDAEFTALETAVNSKSNTASPTFTGTATIPTAAITNITFGGVAITSTAAELNALDGITSTVTELNYTDGVTSAIQTQIDAKAPLNSPVLVTPDLGTPSAATLTNATGLPIVAGTTGTLSTARGGTGVTTASNGQLLIGNGSGFTAATLTAGSGVTLTNGAGSIQVAFTGPGTGDVTLTGVETLTNKTLTAPILTAPVLGTPASGTLTNATGLPAAGVVGTAAILGANIFTGAQEWASGTAIASASTINLNTATGNRVHITGTTAITAVTLTRGPRTVIFDGILTLTHNATTNNLPGAADIITAAGDRAIYESDGTTVYCVNYTKVSGVATVVGSSVPTVIRSARTSNTILGVADQGTLIDITSGTFSQTFTAAATLGNGWFCYLRNSGTGVITLDPNASELIDGLATYIMYPNEARLVQCSGTAFTSVLLASFYHTFTASGTFTKPPGYSAFQGLLWSGGGSGGKSASNVGGGSGAGASFFTLPSSSIGATETVTIASGGASQTSCSSCGNNGGVSSFAVITSSGGKGGIRGGGQSAKGGAGYFASLNEEITCGSNYANTAFVGGRVSSAPGNIGSGFYGGAGAAYLRVASGSVYGGGGGGGTFACCGTNYTMAASASIFGGSGGAASLSTNATEGSIPGGGGGASINGLGNSGAGGRGELRIWGIA